MSRWEPDAPGRLREAAFELYAEQGYDQTTVAQIAARAGLTERTFFRHFADKREVLFQGNERFQAAFVDPVEAAPSAATPLEAVLAGVEAVGSVLPAPRLARRRQALVDANRELRERELVKLSSLGAALTQALRPRGVPDPAAELAAEIGLALFRVVFSRWIEDPDERPWGAHVDTAMEELRSLVAEHGVAAGAGPPSTGVGPTPA